MKVKEMQYESGITIDIEGVYFKETYREIVTLEEGDNPDKVREELQDRVHEVVDKNIEEIRVANKK